MRLSHSFVGSLLLLLGSLVWAGCSGAERSTAEVDRETAIITEGPAPITEAPAQDTSVEMPSLADIMPAPRLDTVQARRFDQGRLWTFDVPPITYFRETYNFEPDSAWFERARLGALRIPGCTASFASPHGLMLTNHHCGRDYLPGLSASDENLLRDGYYAASLDDERRVEGLYAEQLMAIDDVTEEVHAALDAAQTDAERADALQAVTASIQARLLAERDGDEEAYRVQLIALYNGGTYSAYTFRRYTDVRLVMAPEAQIGFYGGEADNFTYPRYSLDMMLFRVYDGGQPLATEHYFPWSNEGPYQGQAVFVVGNPGSSYRLETVAELNFRAAVREPALYRLFVTRSNALQPVFEATQDEALRNELVSLGNAEKAYGGFVKALNDPYLMARIQDREQAFKAELRSDSALHAQFGDLHDRIKAIQEEKLALEDEYGAFLLLRPGAPYGSVTLQRGLVAYEYLQASDAGAGERLGDLRDQLLALADLPEGVDAAFLQERLRDFEHYLGEDSEIVGAILQGRSAEAAAEDLLEASVLASAASTKEAVEDGTLSSDDPVVQAVDALMPEYQAYQSAIAGLQAQEAELARQLGRARFAVYGTDVPPDATFSLRISDGVVSPYEYNGTVAPVVTTFNGMYDLYHAFGAGTDWDLPERWLNPPESFSLSTPINFVATNDILGGNSGSAVLNPSLELVGLAFDGNIESLSGPYIYRTDGPRMVAVDVRGMLEALDEIYQADRIVIELMSGDRIDTEEEADAAASSR